MNQKIFVLLTIAIIISAVTTVVTIYGLRMIDDKDINVNISAYPPVGTTPFNVSFSSFVTNYNGDLNYNWDFGNGQQSKEIEPTIIYYEKGEYICSLKVTDANGKTGSDSLKIVVNSNKPPIVTLSINENIINRDFNWLELLSFTPIASHVGNQQQFLNSIEERKGADAWGEGTIVVTAQITDPEDDEITSYDWNVQTADTLITIGGKELQPVHNLSGEKSVTIPVLYTWIAGRHIVNLNVTDSAGNKANAKIDFMVSQSSRRTQLQQGKYFIFFILLNQIPNFMSYFWKIPKIKQDVSDYLTEHWLDYPPFIQNIISSFLGYLRWDYEPPLPKADLEFSVINDIDLTLYINETTGEVLSGATASSSFTIFNNDSIYPAKNIFITLEKPYPIEEGLDDELEITEFTIEINDGIKSNKLFYNGIYTNCNNSYKILQLTSGGTSTMDLVVNIKEGTMLNKGSYDCKLYIFQSKSLHKAEYVDEVSFTIII
jgi:PKD repeat protein